MKTVEPEVFLVARPEVDYDAVAAYLREVGGDSWLERLDRDQLDNDAQNLASVNLYPWLLAPMVPVIVVILNNRSWGATLHFQQFVSGPNRVIATRCQRFFPMTAPHPRPCHREISYAPKR